VFYCSAFSGLDATLFWGILPLDFVVDATDSGKFFSLGFFLFRTFPAFGRWFGGKPGVLVEGCFFSLVFFHPTQNLLCIAPKR